MRGLDARLRIILFATFVALAPGNARADSGLHYAYLLQWGSSGTATGQFHSPCGVATDASGNVYVVDVGNSRVQKFSSTGAFITTWGSGGVYPGQFNGPRGVSVAPGNQVYVVDSGNSRVEVFSNTGGYIGLFGAPGDLPGYLAYPSGVANDALGYCYIADTGNNRLAKYTDSGTFVWDRGGVASGTAPGEFNAPQGVACDDSGNVYVADTGNNRIQKFTVSGAFATMWGSYGSGNGQFNSPRAVAIDDSGRVFVTDGVNNRVQVFTRTGGYLTQFGSGGSGNGQLGSPWGVATDAAGDVYVGDTNNNRIQEFHPCPLPVITSDPGSQADVVGSAAVFKVSATGTSLTYQWRKSGVPIGGAVDSTYLIASVAPADSGLYDVIVSNACGADTSSAAALSTFSADCFASTWGSYGLSNGQFDLPYGVGTDASGNVYVADTGNDRIQKFTSSGTYLTQWGSYGSGSGQFRTPVGVAADDSDNVYVTDYANDRVQKFTSSGAYLAQWGTLGSGNGQFNGPVGIATDDSNNVYVTDTYNTRVQKFTSSGAYLTQWGSAGTGAGQFNTPVGIATDAAGNVYVADEILSTVQKFTRMGTYLTQWGSYGTADGQLNYPYEIATDAAANVYVADAHNNRIQVFTDRGLYITQWGAIGNGDGQFDEPLSVATDPFKDIYVADYGNHRIEKFSPCGLTACAPVPPDLVGWWKLDGDASDVLGRYPGSVMGGGGSFVPAEVAQGFRPDTATIVAIPNAPALNPPQFTVDAWVKLDSLPVGNPVVVWKGDSGGLNVSSPFALEIYGTSQSPAHVGQAVVTVGDGVQFQEVDANVVAPVGAWVHLAATADGARLNLYQDGVVVGSAAQTVTPAPSGYPLQIGGTIALSWPNSFTGIIDEVELHAAAADSQAIRMIFNAGPAGKCAGVAAVAASSPPRALSLTSAPNPSMGNASLSFYVPQPAFAWLDIFDVGGRRVGRLVSGRLVVGEQHVSWTGRDADGRQLGAGVYFARLRVGGAVRTTRLVVLGH